MTGKVPQYLSWWQENATTKEGKEMFARCLRIHSLPYKKEIRKHIVDSGYESVLDCGAGLCPMYFGFKEDGRKIDYRAFDITPHFVEEGKRQGINIRLGAVENIPYGDNSVDVCLCMDVLNHLFDFKKPIDEMLRVARKEVIITLQHDFRQESSITARYHNEEAVTLIYNFFTRKMFDDYFKSINVEYDHVMISKGRKLGEKNVLYVRKK